MKPKEQTRLQVLNSLLAEQMTLEQASTLMGISPRHTRRILALYREEGAAALAHGLRGRKPANAIPETTKSRVVHLARTVYEGANHTHLSELLSEREGLDIARTTLRRILVNAGLSSPRRRRPPKHRVRRQRMPREGMLIQLDGSYHRWLGEDGPQFTILFAVDDATGCVLGALFCDHEDTSSYFLSYFLLMQGLIRRHGIPLALYTDRHAVFIHRSEYQPARTPTQFGRAMEELGTQLIFALSPQAKEPVSEVFSPTTIVLLSGKERVNRLYWTVICPNNYRSCRLQLRALTSETGSKGRVERTAGTFQDRLITELRLAGATTVAQAKAVLQQFLPRYNRRFGVPAQCPEPAFRPMDPESRLGQILCFKHRRRVARDNTVKYYRHTLQLLPSQQRRSYAGASVVVLEGLDGRLSLQHEGRIIASQEAPPSPAYLRSRNGTSPSAAIPIPDTEPASKPSVADLDLLGTKPDQEEGAHAAAIDDAEVTGLRVVASPQRPTFLQQQRWKAVQQARLQGMSIRRMARELGIHRDTVRRYIDADSPPPRRPPATPTAPVSDIIAD